MYPKLPNYKIHCEINHINRTKKIRQCRYRNRSCTKHMGILHKNLRQKARGGLWAYSLCLLTGPLTTKKTHLNFNSTWISTILRIPTGTLFSSLRSHRQARPPIKSTKNGNSGNKMAKIGPKYRHATQEHAAKRPGKAEGHCFAPLTALCPPRPFFRGFL